MSLDIKILPLWSITIGEKEAGRLFHGLMDCPYGKNFVLQQAPVR
jgi:hypothetical protein